MTQNRIAGTALLVSRIATFLVPVAVISGAVAVAPAQASSADPQQLTFDVVCVKRVPIEDAKWGGMQRSSGIVRMPQDSLKDLIEIAYEVQGEQIAGGPTWAESVRYEIVLRAPESSFMGPFHGEAQAQQMLRAFLAERFRLTFHRERRPLSVAALVVAPNGLKINESRSEPGDWQGIELDSGRLIGRGAPMIRLARILSLSTDQPVLDETGLAGTYDFGAAWVTADDHLSHHQWQYSGANPPTLTPTANSTASSLGEALQKQLGLALEPRKDTVVDFIVIDSAEQPGETSH